MNHFYRMLHNFLNGKSNYEPIRRMLNLIFSLSIASFLFERFYFEYELLEITDYKGAIEFFLKGTFFIPFVLFLIAHYGINIIAYSIFAVTTAKASSKWTGNIIKLKVKKRDINGVVQMLNKLPIIKLPVKVSRSLLLEVYTKFKASITEDQIRKAEEVIKKQKENIEKNFSLLFKAGVACSIYYFYSLPQLGFGLYIFIIVGLLVTLYILWYFYLILDVTPMAIRKIDAEVQQQLSSQALINEHISS